jgi:hypothetical protein
MGIKKQALDLLLKKTPLPPELQRAVANELDKKLTQIEGKVSKKVIDVINEKKSASSGTPAPDGGTPAPGGDPASWTAVSDSTFGDDANNEINAIAYGKNKFVAVGSNGKMAYSEDGIKWTAVADSKFGDYSISDIAYGGNRFVAVGWSDKFAYSADGVKWVAVDSTLADGALAIAYGGNRFVAMGRAGEMAYSTDGAIWTAASNNLFDYIYGITYGGDRFVAVGEQGKIAYSEDGIKWTTAADSKFGASNNTIEGIAYGIASNAGNGNAGSRFVAVGAGGKMAYSTDGAKWTAVSNNLFDYIYGITYGGGRFVAVGHCGQMAYSADGVSWTYAADASSENHLHAIAYGNAVGRFVAGGTGGSMWYSD